MQELFDKLKTDNFKDYEIALGELRAAIHSGQKVDDLYPDDIFFLLRPYCWFLHDPVFQDIMDASKDVLEVIDTYIHELIGESSNPLMGNACLAITNFLVSYVSKGTFDTSEWGMLVGNAETATIVIAQRYEEQLAPKDPEAAAKFRVLADLLGTVEVSKHIASFCLRRIAVDFTDAIQKVLHKLPLDYHDSILHVMSAFPGNQKAIDFLTTFIEQTDSDFLKDKARAYLKEITED